MKTALISGGVLLIVIVGLGIFMFRPATAPEASPLPLTGSPSITLPDFTQSVPTTSPATSISASPTPATTTSPGAAPTSTSISITDTGFAPATLTVPVGTTVTFVNNGQAPHWPASDPHPTHTTLSGFDAKKALQTGETYSYTFSQAGTWGMHDHLNARLTGSITVR